MDKESYHEFPAPPGFTLPEGVQPDQDFTILTTLRMKPDGVTLCMKEINGLPVPKSQSTEMEEDSVGEGMVEAFKSNLPKKY